MLGSQQCCTPKFHSLVSSCWFFSLKPSQVHPFPSIPVATSLVVTPISLASVSATTSWWVSLPPGLPLTNSFSILKPEFPCCPYLASVITLFPSTVIFFELLEFLRLSLSSRFSHTWSNYLLSNVLAIDTAGELTSLNVASMSLQVGRSTACFCLVPNNLFTSRSNENLSAWESQEAD